jgi:hypothetical protein
MTFQQHMQYDIDIWYETLMHAVANVKQHVLYRIFTVLRYSDFRYRPGNGEGFGDYTQPGDPWKWNLASALSHGSRVCIIVPKTREYNGFRNWLTCGQMKRGFSDCAIPHRWGGISTHSAEPVMVNGRVDVKEKKGGHLGGAYGMDLMMGGVSPIHGRNYLEDGLNGHLFFYESNCYSVGPFFERKTYKIIMIGIEASGPVGGGDLFGSVHGTGQEQRGTGVSLYWHKNEDGGNPIGMDSLLGGNLRPEDLPAKYCGMIVHLTRTLRQMRQLAQQPHGDKFRQMLEYVPSQHLEGNPPELILGQNQGELLHSVEEPDEDSQDSYVEQ